MPRVRAVAIDMAREGLLTVTKGGSSVNLSQPLKGPIRLGRTAPDTAGYPTTPDGRYFVVRGRLWRATNPNLAKEDRAALTNQLMDARRALRKESQADRQLARDQVDLAKRALGERGPGWWKDGAPDYNRKLAKNTPYQDWFEQLPSKLKVSKQ